MRLFSEPLLHYALIISVALLSALNARSIVPKEELRPLLRICAYGGATAGTFLILYGVVYAYVILFEMGLQYIQNVVRKF